MASSSHRRVARRSWKHRVTRVTLPAAGVALLVGAASAAVVHEADPVVVAPRDDIIAAALHDDVPEVSRSAERAPLPSEVEADEKVEGELFAVDPVEIHAGSDDDSPVLARVEEGDTVEVTGETDGDWTQIVHKGLPRWVSTESLAEKMPEPPAPEPSAPEPTAIGTEPCATGSAAESGLQPDTIAVHRAVCALFPEVSSYGGRAGRGEHATGRALDIMISSDRGNDIAAYLQEHRRELGVSQLIWRQRIWTVQRAGDGWRSMSDRGGATANHFDHVHVTTFGNAGTGSN